MPTKDPNTITTLEEYMNEHGSVIVSFDEPRIIGELNMLNCDNGHGERIVNQPTYVVREATEAEFLAQDPNLRPSTYREYYYELRTD